MIGYDEQKTPEKHYSNNKAKSLAIDQILTRINQYSFSTSFEGVDLGYLPHVKPTSLWMPSRRANPGSSACSLLVSQIPRQNTVVRYRLREMPEEALRCGRRAGRRVSRACFGSLGLCAWDVSGPSVCVPPPPQVFYRITAA